jgi:DNA-binding response OmpR family regulator
MPDILIVDDQPCVRALLSEELVHEGYRVEGLGDAKSVRTRLRFMRPDLVLLDLYLDGADGWELLRNIKRQHPQLPVLIVTAYDSFVDDPRLSQADGYFVKSLDFMDLKQKIADLLRRKSSLQTEAEAKRHFGKLTVVDLPC